MEPRDTDRILGLAEAIADGRAIAWDENRGESTGARDPLLEQLAILARLSDVHRCGELDAAGAAPSAPAVPREWGPFEVIEEIGRGSFGAVYRARDLRLDRDIALKLFPAHAAGASGALTVVSEGRLLAKISHPNVITVFGADVVDGRAGVWMELLHGRTLQEELDDRGPLGAREAAVIGIDLCKALAAVHKAGLVHRDVKAQNVMRAAGGRIVLMDFGAGRELQDAAGAVEAGTPLYMAPEVLSGGTATPGADLYSLGVLLYHLVTNDFPWSAGSLDELKAVHRHGTPTRLRDVRPDLPASFIRAVEDATAANPALRIPTAAAFEARLEAVLVSTGEAPPPPRPVWRRYAAVAAVTLVIAASLTFGWYGDRIRSAFAPPATGIRSLVVLPFANLTGQTDQEYLSDSVTQILNGNLARLKPLNVTSNTSAMSYKNRPKALAEIARELNVDGVIEGSVARSGDRLRITVQLLRADEQRVWGQTYERPAGDLFKVTGEISGMIADAVRLSLTPDERRTLTTSPGVEVQAQEAFLRGLHRLNDFRAETLKLALADLQRAVALDPSSARAYAALSQCYRILGAAGTVSRDEAYRNALLAATRALQLNDTVAEAHIEIAEVKFYYEWNWEWAAREYERALELNPSNSHAMARYSLFLSALGRADEAIRWANQAQQLDPLSTTVRFAPGMALYYAGRYDDAIAAFLKLKELPQYTLTASDRVGLARAYAARARYAEAIAEMTAALAQPQPPAAWVAELARIHAVAGNRKEANRLLDSLAPQRDANAASIAFVLIALGSVDAAFDALDRAAEARAPSLLWLNVDPRFDPVRTDPRLRDLARRIGVPQ